MRLSADGCISNIGVTGVTGDAGWYTLDSDGDGTLEWVVHELGQATRLHLFEPDVNGALTRIEVLTHPCTWCPDTAGARRSRPRSTTMSSRLGGERALAELRERFEMLKFLPRHTARMIADRARRGVVDLDLPELESISTKGFAEPLPCYRIQAVAPYHDEGAAHV